MIQRNSDQKKTHLYMEVCQYYKKRIIEKKLPPGSKMPSLRKCAKELGLSRTTIESAYLQLCAEGYIIAKAQSGYFVTEAAVRSQEKKIQEQKKAPPILYDFASFGVDQESFRFDLWSRYMKSALRQEERLLTYGEAQGEADFRQTLAEYVRSKRNILCSPEDVVVGASVQCLLQILCPLILESALPLPKDPSTVSEKRSARNLAVSFPNPSFIQGCTVFQDFGFPIHYQDKDCPILYVTPAHMTKWGEIMPVTHRLQLLDHAKRQHSLVIEDDFENEFVYLQRPTPSLFGLDGGENVVYIGSFSRLLLPSIRISFMVLPPALKDAYKKKAACYNQTASKAEQIALCQFIRDGHLASQTRKLRRLYSAKQKQLRQAIQEVFGADSQILSGPAGTSAALTLPLFSSEEDFLFNARQKGLLVRGKKSSKDTITLILSCSSLPSQHFLPACQLLKEVLEASDR